MTQSHARVSLDTELYIEHIRNPDLAWLEQQWCELEDRAPNNVFLSWFWIGTWLEVFIDDFTLVIARSGFKTIGLGILVNKKSIGNLDSYYLHRTGNQSLDKIWIEYNDFLMDKDCVDWLRAALNQYVMRHIVKGKGYYFGVSEEKVLANSGLDKCASDVKWEAMGYRLNLHNYQSFDHYNMHALSKNSRYQIRRSIKKYQQHTDIQCYQFPHQQIERFFDECSQLHIARWGNVSGFKYCRFSQFHRKLAEKGVEQQIVKLYHLASGDKLLGYVYNFEYKGTVYFYLSAFDYQFSDKHLKPGLVTHYLLIQDAMQRDFQFYDFMGGESQYKRTLSDEQVMLQLIEYRNQSAANSLLVALDKVNQWRGQNIGDERR